MKAGQCFYMTGLTDSEFDCLFDCVEPYLSCLIHPDSKCNGSGNRKMDIKTELMAFMTILRFPPGDHCMDDKHKYCNSV